MNDSTVLFNKPSFIFALNSDGKNVEIKHGRKFPGNQYS